MPRFDVYRNSGEYTEVTPYLLDVQSDLLQGLETRIVVPLRRRDRFPAVNLPANLMPMFEIEGVECLRPEGAFYAFPKVDVKVSDTELAMEILKAGVICSPGVSFGLAGAGHLRFSYANNVENIEKGIAIVKKVIKKFR